MEIHETTLPGVLRLCPRSFKDDRGHFLETFNEKAFNEAVGSDVSFVQDNESCSRINVLRGLHFQIAPHAQGKLVRVVKGAVLDVVVDIRASSPTFGKHFKQLLDDRNKEMLWIPAGMAHGFLSLEADTIFVYKCTEYYAPKAERTILWNDPELAIEWGVDNPIVSAKDRDGFALRGEWARTTV